MAKRLIVFAAIFAVFVAYEAVAKTEIDYLQAVLLGLAGVVGNFVGEKMRASKRQ